MRPSTINLDGGRCRTTDAERRSRSRIDASCERTVCGIAVWQSTRSGAEQDLARSKRRRRRTAAEPVIEVVRVVLTAVRKENVVLPIEDNSKAASNDETAMCGLRSIREAESRHEVLVVRIPELIHWPKLCIN